MEIDAISRRLYPKTVSYCEVASTNIILNDLVSNTLLFHAVDEEFLFEIDEEFFLLMHTIFFITKHVSKQIFNVFSLKNQILKS